MIAKIIGVLTLSLLILSGCLLEPSSDSTSNDTPKAGGYDATLFYPTGLAVSSPTERTNLDATITAMATTPQIPSLTGLLHSIRSWAIRDATAATSKIPRYTWATLKIDSLLKGSSIISTTFVPEKFLTHDSNAGCFGPQLDYTDHPDSLTPNNGQLPSGDLGIWSETDTTTGDTCAAAQLNSRMSGVSWRSNMALMGLASMVGEMDRTGVSLPSAGGSVDNTALMNTLSISGVNFTSAVLSLDSANTVWSYTLNFDYTDSSSVIHPIEISLTHTPGSSTAIYSGLLSYSIGEKFNGGNCPGTGSRDVTQIGTLAYTRSGLKEMDLIQRHGQYCGSGSAASLASYDTSGLLDPAGKWDSSASTGWADNFSRFGANYNPITLAGTYIYGWQAGFGDSNSRIFAIGLNAPTTSDASAGDGEAYFGFGDDIASTTVSLLGLYCNWAAPGSSKTLQPYVQRQFVSWDESSEQWQTPAGGSDILYAPTNNCQYDGTGTFWYDRNLNSAVDESISDLEVHSAGSGSSPKIDLMDTNYGGTVYPNIAAVVAARGYTAPAF